MVAAWVAVRAAQRAPESSAPSHIAPVTITMRATMTARAMPRTWRSRSIVDLLHAGGGFGDWRRLGQRADPRLDGAGEIAGLGRGGVGRRGRLAEAGHGEGAVRGHVQPAQHLLYRPLCRGERVGDRE